MVFFGATCIECINATDDPGSADLAWSFGLVHGSHLCNGTQEPLGIDFGDACGCGDRQILVPVERVFIHSVPVAGVVFDEHEQVIAGSEPFSRDSRFVEPNMSVKFFFFPAIHDTENFQRGARLISERLEPFAQNDGRSDLDWASCDSLDEIDHADDLSCSWRSWRILVAVTLGLAPVFASTSLSQSHVDMGILNVVGRLGSALAGFVFLIVFIGLAHMAHRIHSEQVLIYGVRHNLSTPKIKKVATR